MTDLTCPWPDKNGFVVTYTIDKLAYSPSPPIVFAVVDFDGGGRLPVELTAARAFFPRKFPTIRESAVLYICWNRLPSKMGRAK